MTRILQNDKISKTKFLMTATSIVISLTKKLYQSFIVMKKSELIIRYLSCFPHDFTYSQKNLLFENYKLVKGCGEQLNYMKIKITTLTTWDVVKILRLKVSDFGHHKPRGTKAWTVLISSHKWPYDGTAKRCLGEISS